MVKAENVNHCVELVVLEWHLGDICYHVVGLYCGQLLGEADGSHLGAPVQKGQISAWRIEAKISVGASTGL